MQIESWCVAYLSEVGQENSGLIWEQQVHVLVGQTGNPPVLEVRPEILTGKPRVLHINLLLPFDFHQVDHPDPSANQSQGKVPSSSPRKARERLQNDKLGTSDSVDEDDSSGLSLTEFETLQLCTPTGDTERRREGKAEVTNETMTEDVATPHGDDVTDDPVLPDSEVEDELVPGAGDRKKTLPVYPHATATECVVVISWEILVTTLAVHQVFK